MMREGQRRNCPVMVYLHSDLHGDTEDFLRGTLCTQEVCEAVQGVGYLSWVGRVHEKVGWEASLKLEAHAFPFLERLCLEEGATFFPVGKVPTKLLPPDDSDPSSAHQ